MSWVVKCAALGLGFWMALGAQAREVYVLALGQSLAANCNEHVYGAVPGVFLLGGDGSERPAADPLEGSDCRQGSMWMPMARQMVATGLADRVVLVPVGVSGAKVNDWTPGGAAFARLQGSLVAARQRGVVFDFALWHQGEQEATTSREAYRSAMSRVMREVSVSVPVRHWLVARHSRCSGQVSPEVAEAQQELSGNPVLRRFAGPDTDRLGSAYRMDGCHLNHAGQEEMARRWVDSMHQALASSARVDKESLLHYFRWDLAALWASPPRVPSPARAQVAAAH